MDKLMSDYVNGPLIEIYTDGACINNGCEDSSGGWAAILEGGGSQIRMSGSEKPTTNNRMELRAVLEGLKAIPTRSTKVRLYTDSAYARNGCRTWLPKWKENGWRKSDKKPVENLDLWQQIDELLGRHDVEFFHVKAHSGHPQNTLADRLAVAASHGQTVRKYGPRGASCDHGFKELVRDRMEA